jgi:hypothetical protein
MTEVDVYAALVERDLPIDVSAPPLDEVCFIHD